MHLNKTARTLALLIVGIGLSAQVEAVQVYYTDVASGTAAIIRRVNSDGSGMTNLVTGLQHPRGMALDVSGGKMYWTDNGLSAIRRANIDGTGVETVVTTGDASGAVALDLSARKLYWTTATGPTLANPRIGRANLDGSGQENLVTNGLVHPVGIALDTMHGKLYWTDLEGNYDGTGSIRRSNLDGSNPETLLTSIDESSGIAVDVSGGKIYWTEIATHRIQRANLDGTGVEDVVVNLNTPTTLSLDLFARKMYWSDSESSGQVNRISKANLDGSGLTVIVTGGFPWGVAVDGGAGVDLIKAVKPAFSNLTLTRNYQMQISGDLNNWTNHGAAFTATNSSMIYPEYFDVENWNSLFFRLQVSP